MPRDVACIQTEFDAFPRDVACIPAGFDAVVRDYESAGRLTLPVSVKLASGRKPAEPT